MSWTKLFENLTNVLDSLEVLGLTVAEKFTENELSGNIYAVQSLTAGNKMGFGIYNNSLTENLSITIDGVDIVIPAGKSDYKIYNAFSYVFIPADSPSFVAFIATIEGRDENLFSKAIQNAAFPGPILNSVYDGVEVAKCMGTETVTTLVEGEIHVETLGEEQYEGIVFVPVNVLDDTRDYVIAGKIKASVGFPWEVYVNSSFYQEGIGNGAWQDVMILVNGLSAFEAINIDTLEPTAGTFDVKGLKLIKGNEHQGGA